MFQRAQKFSSALLADDMVALENQLAQSNSFKEHDEKPLKILA